MQTLEASCPTIGQNFTDSKIFQRHQKFGCCGGTLCVYKCIDIYEFVYVCVCVRTVDIWGGNQWAALKGCQGKQGNNKSTLQIIDLPLPWPR